ncbi:hypothetical protein COL516b_010552 [Colletotrichum fioriniae]|nr:uncharacterized protein COL516b_010552 [Colletotrichum fioriniae]KAJ0297697.1 hypothetical protein COL516b_010552 [Colletotrichum fioriniae]
MRPYLSFTYIYQPSPPRRNVEGDFHVTQKFPNLEFFHLDAPEFPFFIKLRREVLKSVISTLSSYQFPTLVRHATLIILSNNYGPFQQLPQMTKDGESDPLFVGLRRAIFSEFENIERSYLEHIDRDKQYSVSGPDRQAVWTVNEKVMLPMPSSIAKERGQMISLEELRFRVI